MAIINNNIISKNLISSARAINEDSTINLQGTQSTNRLKSSRVSILEKTQLLSEPYQVNANEPYQMKTEPLSDLLNLYGEECSDGDTCLNVDCDDFDCKDRHTCIFFSDCKGLIHTTFPTQMNNDSAMLSRTSQLLNQPGMNSSLIEVNNNEISSFFKMNTQTSWLNRSKNTLL